MSQRQAGVSLIELITVVMIVGILAAIAYPSYRQQVLRSGRTEAKAALMQAAQGLENCFTRFGAYNDPGCAIADNLVDPGIMSPEGLYRVQRTAIGATSFTLRAIPQPRQASDVACGFFTLNESGLRGVQGSLGAQACW